MLSASGLTTGLIETGPVAEGPFDTIVILIFCWFFVCKIKREER
jgi:hypothetical protein